MTSNQEYTYTPSDLVMKQTMYKVLMVVKKTKSNVLQAGARMHFTKENKIELGALLRTLVKTIQTLFTTCMEFTTPTLLLFYELYKKTSTY